MYSDTKEKIISIVNSSAEGITPHMLSVNLGIGKVALHRHLKVLVEKGQIMKVGLPPRVIYLPNFAVEDKPAAINLKPESRKIIEAEFINITPDGRFIEGVQAFVNWCNSRGFDVEKKSAEFIKYFKKYSSYEDADGIIDGSIKFKSTFEDSFLDQVHYLSFYSWETFGKTKLGTLLLYAKQSQNKQLMEKIISEIKEKIFSFIKKRKFDALLFVPPTEKRELQLMKVFEKNLNPGLPEIKIYKLKNEIVVPQKTLSKLSDREQNASATFYIPEKNKYKNILIIDDAIGSGATMNIIAKKIRQVSSNKPRITGLAITGSFKGFDVISRA